MGAPDGSFKLRTLAGIDEFDAVARLLATAFGQDFTSEDVDQERTICEPHRDHVIEAAGEFVANAGVYTRQLTVPGNVLPAAHVTQVGVRPTYRRQGLLTRLMRHQLREVREEYREPVAVLWASEGRIYQRYGYGLGTLRQSMDIDGREVALNAAPSGDGRLRDAAPTEVLDELRQVYERVRPHRPGWSERDNRWWAWRLLDRPGKREGYTERRALVFYDAEGPSGYALWRARSSWNERGPQGETSVHELVAANPQAYAALWRFLLSVDLNRTVQYWYAAVDEPLIHLVNEPRALGLRSVDGLWVRLTDVAAALAGRRYAAELDMVFEVSDALLPDNAGRWRLSADRTGARCASTRDLADLECDVADLGAAYLAGTSLGALGAAGRVRELRPGALVRASAAFGWHRAPAPIDGF